MIDNNKPEIIPAPAKGFKRILLACLYSFHGFRAAWKEEAAFRQIFLMFCLAMAGALIFTESWTGRILLILPAWICVIVELLNTAIENVVDLYTDKWHPLAKKAKDLGSAAQLASQLLLLFVWGSYFAGGAYQYFVQAFR